MKVDFRAVVSRIYFIPIIWGILFTSACKKEEAEWPTPTFTFISTTMAPAGKEVVITGKNFAPSILNNTVTFNGTPAKITMASFTSLTATVPEGATTGPVLVTSYGKSVLVGNFTVFILGKVTSLSPICGPLGTVVTAAGEFKSCPSCTTVEFEHPPNTYYGYGTLISSSSTKLTFAVPPAALTGKIRFSYSGESFVIEDDVSLFTIANFKLTEFTAPTGLVGTTLIIKGSYFDTNPANITVRFTGAGSTTIDATAFVSDPDHLNVTIPPGAVTGPLSVRMNGPLFVTFPDDFVVVP